MENGKKKWNSERLAVWIHGLMMPTSSQSLSRPATVGDGSNVSLHINPLLLPEGEVSFIELNKSRTRPSQVFLQKRAEVDKFSVFLERVAGEIGPEVAQKTERNRRRICEILAEVLQMAFALEPRFMRAFEMPLMSSLLEEGGLETVSQDEFNFRLFLHKFEHPDGISTISGVQDDLPPGVALCRISQKLTPPEQMRTRQQMGAVIDELGYVSPSRIYPWFAHGLVTAAQAVLQKRRSIFRDDDKEQLKVDLQFPQATLELSSAKSDDAVVVNVFPVIRGMGWPRGTILQHGLPKQRRYAECGQACLNEINKRIDDGQTMWYLEARPVRLDPSLQKKARFRGGLRRILGGVDRFWQISLGPAQQVIFDNAALRAESEYNIRLIDMRNTIMAIARANGWVHLTPSLVDTFLLWSVKRAMTETRAVAPFFFEVLGLLQRTLVQGSCPDFLMPNVNAAASLLEGAAHPGESKMWAHNLGLLMADIKTTPSDLLRYVGFYNKTDSRARSVCKSASTRKSRTHSRQSSYTTIHSQVSKLSKTC